MRVRRCMPCVCSSVCADGRSDVCAHVCFESVRISVLEQLRNSEYRVASFGFEFLFSGVDGFGRISFDSFNKTYSPQLVFRCP